MPANGLHARRVAIACVCASLLLQGCDLTPYPQQRPINDACDANHSANRRTLVSASASPTPMVAQPQSSITESRHTALATKAELPSTAPTTPKASAAAGDSSQSSTSSFWLIHPNSVAVPCAFAGTPKLLCLDDGVDTSSVISDVVVSAACPVDVLVASRVASEVNWMLYAQAGKGLEVHGAALPLTASRIFTIAVAQKPGQPYSMDVRCGVTTVWRPTRDPVTPSGTESSTQIQQSPEPTAKKLGNTPGF